MKFNFRPVIVDCGINNFWVLFIIHNLNVSSILILKNLTTQNYFKRMNLMWLICRDSLDFKVM
jgi:hypothetical protein